MTKHRIALGCAAACLLGAVSVVPASAEEDTFLGTVMHSLGLRNGKEASIDYRERSPLVIPPKRELPAPERASVESNPAWPIDPEIKARKEKDELESYNTSQAFDDQARVLRPDQMTPGRKFSKGRSARTPAADPTIRSDNENGRVLRPSELGSNTGLLGMFRGKDEETAKFTSEPPRASLTDPPVGYQTPSAAAPYGLGKEAAAPVKPTDYKTEHGTRE